MFRRLGIFAIFALIGTGCMSYSDQKALHATAQKDFGCPAKTSFLDTRTEAKPVNMGNTNRMSVQGCGHKAIYDWDRQQGVWTKEPGSDPADAETDAKAKAASAK
jgi:hypothetical protein